MKQIRRTMLKIIRYVKAIIDDEIRSMNRFYQQYA